MVDPMERPASHLFGCESVFGEARPIFQLPVSERFFNRCERQAFLLVPGTEQKGDASRHGAKQAILRVCYYRKIISPSRLSRY